MTQSTGPSCPAWIRLTRSLRQVPNRSIQPSVVYSYLPNFDTENSAPPVVLDSLHRRAAPFPFRTVAIKNVTRDLIVAVGENVGFHGKPAAIDLRRNMFDDYTAVAVCT
jgi:hypothetical protein